MKEIREGIAASVQKLYDVTCEVELSRPDAVFGDFASNIALQLAKQVNQKPREIAETLADTLKTELEQYVSEVTVAGPGFINLRLADTVLLNQLQHATTIPQTLAGQNVVAEYSDPNPFKELHAGHLYTTLVGDAIARLIEAGGAQVHRINYGGDVGLHAARSMWAILQFLGGEHPEALHKIIEADRPTWLSKRYVEGTAAYEDNEQAKAEIIAINKRIYQLHQNADTTSDFAKIYWVCREWSYNGFEKLYQDLHVTPFDRYLPESESTPAGIAIVERGVADGVFQKSDGAIVFRGEDQGLHTRVFINSAGLPTYEAKDLGLASIKWNDYHFDRNVIITGNDIVEYMKVVLKALGHFYPEAAQRTSHITHGMIMLPGAVKMSSRKGNVLRAFDILDAAEQAAKAVADNAEHQTVLAAVKYSFLKNRIGGDIIYDPAESVTTEGNSGPYLQYAHARARSILGKGSQPTPADSLEMGERLLALKISEFPEIVTKATEELAPHLVCTFLYELAQTFNRFYEQYRVIGDNREAQRLYLVQQYAVVLKTGLGLLGIHAPEHM